MFKFKLVKYGYGWRKGQKVVDIM